MTNEELNEIYSDAAVFGSAFMRYNAETMTFEIVPLEEIMKSASEDEARPLRKLGNK